MKARFLNAEVREAIEQSGLKHYQIANTIGVSAITFARWLQSELTPEKKAQIMEALKSCKAEEAHNLNADIRAIIKEKGLAQYEIANEIGINPITFSSWLQSELNQERKERVLAAIESIKA